MEVMTLERTLTELDHVRLLNLLRRDAHADRLPAPLQAVGDLLDACVIVPSRQVAPDVVTMGSEVIVEDRQTRQRTTMTLCYPADAEPALGRVSVLSPVGSALLGLRVGSLARWALPTGDEKAAEVLAVLFQPEAGGDYVM
ncbi:transcription elongation factor GreAB [Pelomonas sp. Root1217]|uniref:GreA/GreB family elongation factor n=1 Tax=Pelomonas sp. Root1217 TaxID=1736430 RepID=UPI00070899F7|nr:GreA/GreB family elongation factor [Pelomonas sp. Root1217]KQV55018.1 transcription elongation factor GreAB [Pelomonas sp. Root1217]